MGFKHLKMDKGKARIKDIAELAGVSHGTVDRVIHNRGEVSEITRQRIQQIIEELNYEPDLSAKTLASKKTYRLALCMPDPSRDGSFWQSPLIGADKAITEIQHLGITCKRFLYSQMDPTSFKRCSRDIIDYNPDGLILAPAFPDESLSLIDFCDRHHIPYLFINSKLEGKNNLTFIGQDEYQSGRVAGRLMKERLSGEEELLIAHVTSLPDNFTHLQKRQKGLESCFSNKERLHCMKIEEQEQEAIHNEIMQYLLAHPGIKGIFVTNSKTWRVASFLKKYGYPLYLVGYDLTEENLMYLEDRTINILISQKSYDQGYLSIKALFNILVLNKPVEKEYKMPIEIIIKENMNHLNTSYLL